MRRVTALVVLTVLLAGCVSPDETAPEPTPTPDTLYQDERITIENITDTPLQPPTLLEPPQWRLGEWWSVEITEFFAGQSYSSTRVIAGAEATDYLVGMPTHDFSNAIMVLHIPGFGQVSRSDLSYEIHDCRYHVLQFPLELGATWNTTFECREVSAEVVEVTETTATVEMVGPNDFIRLTYDAEMRQIVHWVLEGYAEYRVDAHGFAFHSDLPKWEGLVTVPHMHDVIFMHGRVAGALGGAPITPTPLGPSMPFDTVEVDSTYDRVSFVMATGNALYGVDQSGTLAGAPVGGYYKITATAPDGTEYVVEQLPTENAVFKIDFLKHDKPDGVWEFEHIATGPGLTSAEGIAYHVYDVELPTGRILPSIGEHQHGEGEGH